MSISNIDVATIAQGLEVRQKLQGPTLLFLGARAGSLFRSETFYKALSSYPLPSLVTLDQAKKFQRCVRLLEEDRFSEKDIHYILSQSLNDSFIQETDKYVAALIKHNFFQLIVTTNLDGGLEAALSQFGSRINKDFDVFIPDVQARSSIPSLSVKHISDQYPLFTLVKLYGEVAINRYDLKHRGEFFDSNRQLYQELRNMHNWNILMVGFDPVWDAATVRLLFPCTGKLWYVNEETPPPDSEIFRYVQVRNAHCLLGDDGDSDTFFESLHQHIVGSTPPPLSDPEVEPLLAKSEPPLLTGKLEPNMPPRSFVSRSHAKSLVSPQLQVDVLLLATSERDLTALLKQHSFEASKYTVRGKTCYNLGKIGDATVFLMQADEWNNGLAALGEQIQELAPACIIILGIAWGFKYKGQNIGHLLIPDRILIYNLKQESSNTTINTDSGTDAYLQIGRNQKLVRSRLLNLFKNADIILHKKTRGSMSVTFGPLFTCVEAMDRQTAFEYASKVAPGTIGIEIGDATLFSLAQSYQTNSLLVKGISALADVDNPTDDEAPDPDKARENAAQFVLDVLALGGFHNPRAR